MIFVSSISYEYGHSLKQKPETEDFRIRLATFTVQYGPGSSVDLIQRSFCFSPPEFIEEDESPEKQKLLCSLTNSGFHQDDAQQLITGIVSLASDVIHTIPEGFKGVLALFLDIFIEVVQDEDDRGIEHAVQESFDETKIQFRPASKLAIESLKRRKLKKRGIAKKKCTVCLERLVAGAKVASLPCGHEFHEGCIVEWLETSHLCPLCRFSLPSEREQEPKL